MVFHADSMQIDGGFFNIFQPPKIASCRLLSAVSRDLRLLWCGRGTGASLICCQMGLENNRQGSPNCLVQLMFSQKFGDLIDLTSQFFGI